MTDTDIDNYTVDNILAIFNISDPTPFNVQDVANTLIAKMTTEGKTDLVTFFTEARDKVLDYLTALAAENLEVTNESHESLNKVWTDAALKSKPDDPLVNVNRYFGGSSRLPAEEIANPLGNAIKGPPIIAKHIINIDSQYRTTILPYSSSPLSSSYNTNFTFQIANPIYRAVSLSLYSYQLPTSWYAFSAAMGNTFFMYNGVVINIPDGNYTPTSLVAAINTAAAANVATIGLTVTYNHATNLISFTNNDGLSGPITIIFYIQANLVNTNNCGALASLGSFQTLGINTTLGYLLGFRTTPDPTTGDVSITINPLETIVADVSPYTYGPKYFVLSLEDYSNQRLTSGLYNITDVKAQVTSSIPDTVYSACKLRSGSLTLAQQYSINAVINPDTASTTLVGFSNKISGPNLGTAFAMIPLTNITALRPDPYVKFGTDLFIYKRSYLAPTYLQRFSVSLTDDKGFLVNLHDNDWSFSLIVEEQLN